MIQILLNILDKQWIENHFLYFSLVGAVIIIYLVYLILTKTNKDIKEFDKKSRKYMIDFMKNTSKRNKKEKKRLKF